MTEEAQRIAIAEVCGWRYVTNELYFNKLYQPNAVPPIGKCCGKHISKEEAFRSSFNVHPETVYPVPDYLHSLDAMHEAEKVLTQAQDYDYRATILPSVCGDGSGMLAITATAAQRAEAFLRTLNFWDDMK